MYANPDKTLQKNINWQTNTECLDTTSEKTGEETRLESKQMHMARQKHVR